MTNTQTRENKRKFGSGFFEILQRVGRAFMLPIALLPIAGLLLGIGASFTNEATLEAYNLLGIMCAIGYFNTRYGCCNLNISIFIHIGLLLYICLENL